MGTNTIPEATDGTTIPASDHNSLRTSQIGDLVPRNSSGAPQADGGSLGTETYPFTKANISQGYLFVGQVIMFHDFNGAISPGKGWMKCNGDVVNETNYDAIHGSGAWDDHASGSPLASKNLPDFDNRYPVGVDDTDQDGSSAITSVGNAGHFKAMPDHYHTIFAQKTNVSGNTYHQVYFAGAISEPDNKTTDISSANPVLDEFFLPAVNANDAYRMDGTSTTQAQLASAAGISAANNVTLSTDDDAVGNIDFQPGSIELEFWIKVI